MTRLAYTLVGVAIGLIAGAACGVHSQPEVSDDVASAAHEAGVDPVDLLGATFTTGLQPRDYLVAVGEIAPRPPVLVSSATAARVRLTYYLESGVTFGGGRPSAGSTACSWNFRLGTRFVLPDGEIVRCNDRGLLGSSGWLDLWRRADLVRRYGPFATVEVLP